MEENFEVQKLVNEWIATKATRNNTTGDLVDLRKIQDENKDNFLQAKITMIEGLRHELSRKKSDKHSKIQNVSAGQIEDGRCTTEMNETVSLEHGLSLTAGVNIGISASAPFIGLDFSGAFSGTKEKKHTKTESIKTNTEFALQKGQSYQVKKDVYEIWYESDVDIEMIIDGKVPVKFNDKIHYPVQSHDKAHRKWDIPITDIFDDLMKEKKLPSGFTYKKVNDKAVCNFKGKYKYNQYEGNIQLINTSTAKIENSKKVLSKPDKIKDKIFTGTAENKINAKAGARVQVGNVRTVHTAIDISPENMKYLPPSMLALIENSVTQGTEFKDINIKSNQNVDADPSANVQTEGVFSGLHHFNFKNQSSSDIPKSTMFDDKNKKLDRFGQRVFLEVEKQLKQGNLPLPSKDKHQIIKDLLKSESLSDIGDFVMSCTKNHDSDNLRLCSTEIAKEIIKGCKDDIKAFEVNDIMFEDGFSHYNKQLKITENTPTKTLGT